MTGLPIPALIVAVAVSLALSFWWYERWEEAVEGRAAAAALRAAALFLVLGGLWLPPLRGPGPAAGGLVLLLDRSASMSLPVRPGGRARLDSARVLVRSLDPDRVIAFGATVVEVSGEDLSALGATEPHTRLAGALELARVRGADSVLVLTDGELDDRLTSLRAAERLGVGVREIRISADIPRIGIRGVEAPRTALAGDTAWLVVDIVTGGTDSGVPTSPGVSVRLDGPAGPLHTTRVSPPTAGRSVRAILPLVPARPAGSAEWRSYTLSLGPEADPYAAADVRRLWIEVTAGARAAVVVSEDPDWEARWLLPVLERSVAGGARAYLRLASDRYVRGGKAGRVVSGSTVRRDAESSVLLVVQGAPRLLPGWLRETAARHARLLLLARGPGNVPGAPLVVGDRLGGEWYAIGPPPPSPVSGLLAGVDYGGLPPLTSQRAATGPSDWSPLSLRRDRRGVDRPIALAVSDAERRRVVMLGEGTWRWAARAGAPRQLYRSLYAGLAGWLVEAGPAAPITLAEDPLRSNSVARWRVTPGVRDLAISVTDSLGEPVWSGAIDRPDTVVPGPRLPTGDYRLVASGASGDRGFRIERPFTVIGPWSEFLPRRMAARLSVRGVTDRRRPPIGDGPAVWPFALAALLLCAEWAWRRKIGLR